MDINGYKDLITTENQQAPKFMAFLESILTPVMELQEVVQNSQAFSIDSAAGNQLDIVGEVIGLPRQLPYITSRGTADMTDDEYLMGIKLKIAQESWEGGNKSATDIYQEVVNASGANVSYDDLMDGNVTISIDVESQEIVQVIYAIGGFLVPIGVGKTVEVNDTGVSMDAYCGVSVTGVEYEDFVELGGGE